MGNFDEAVLNAALDVIARNQSYTLNTQVWVKLHTGDPGASGASNAAVNTTRQQATFGSAASAGAVSNTVAIEWTNVSTTETYSWVSLWSLSAAGTFLGNDQLSANAAVQVGDTFRIPIGDLDLTLTSGI